MSEILQRFVRADELTPDQGWRLIEWCIERGGDEFSSQVMSVDDNRNSNAALTNALAPFRLGTPKRENITTLSGQKSRRPTNTWKLGAESASVLRQHIPDGLFAAPSCSKNGWIEDFTIYRHGEIMLGVVSHEQQIILRLAESEYKELSRMGITSRENPA